MLFPLYSSEASFRIPGRECVCLERSWERAILGDIRQGISPQMKNRNTFQPGFDICAYIDKLLERIAAES